jgi:two-component system chemotaxis response regulator CheB
MPKKDIVVIGASAGGVPVLKELVEGLPAEIPAAVFIVLHVGASDRSYLAEILQKKSALPVTQAENGESIRRGRIYVARPDYHLLVEASTVRLARGPRENRSRPAIDALFRSAAHAHGSSVLGVILTGTLDDGSAGIWWVKDRGGTAIIQNPDEAEFPSMPLSALSNITADHVTMATGIGPLLSRLCREEAPPSRGPSSNDIQLEDRISKEGRALQLGVMNLGPITPYTCPECHGILVFLKEGGVPRFRCHTGHAYSLNTLLAELTEQVEESLWSSMRSIEESAMLLQHIARHVREKGGAPEAARLFEQKAEDTLQRAELVRRAVNEHQTLSSDNVAEVKTGAR